MSCPVRVLIADDHTLFRGGLAQLLSEDPRVVVVGQAADGLEAVEQCDRLDPDVVLMDMRMPKMDGLEATRRIVGSGAATKILFLTTFDGGPEVLAAINAGASGYVLKDAQIEALICSVVAVMHGEQVLAGAAAAQMAGSCSGRAAPTNLHDNLTARETEILRFVADGVTTKQIARRLEISDKTVRNHLSHIYEKLQIGDRTQAMLYAMRKGMVQV